MVLDTLPQVLDIHLLLQVCIYQIPCLEIISLLSELVTRLLSVRAKRSEFESHPKPMSIIMDLMGVQGVYLQLYFSGGDHYAI